MAGKSVAKKSGTAVATHDYGDMGGKGFEDVKGTDLSIPFINVLQSNSPEVEEELIPGAKTGDMLNTVTKELIKPEDGFIFQPVRKTEAWVEWVPRTKGGGFVAAYDPMSEEVKKAIAANNGSRIPPKGEDGKRIPFKINGNDLIETYYMYGLLLDSEGSEMQSFAVLSFSSTKIKPYRDWLTSMYLMKERPPLFAHRAHITTVKQKNDSGTFANFNISPFKDTWFDSLIDPKTESTMLEAAIEFEQMLDSGIAKADFNQQGAETAPSTADGEAPF